MYIKLSGDFMFCKICGKKIEDGATFCPQCGAHLDLSASVSTSNAEIKQNILFSSKSRLVALLLAYFLGIFGIHNFYLGHIGKGISKIVMLILGLFLMFFGVAVIGIEAYNYSDSFLSVMTDFDIFSFGIFFLVLFFLGIF